MRGIAAALVGAALIGGCAAGPRLVVDRMDETLPHASIGTPGWDYARVASADLDGDGVIERAVVIARVSVKDGEPVWDDWNVWQVYVEEPTGERTYIYSGPVQLGLLEPYLTVPNEYGRRAITIVEHAPHSVTLYDVVYDGPNNARLFAAAERIVDPASGFKIPSVSNAPRR